MIKKESKNLMRIKRHRKIRQNLSGTETAPRLCVFRSNSAIYAQIIDDTKGIKYKDEHIRRKEGKKAA